jgi:hypothetical protein
MIGALFELGRAVRVLVTSLVIALLFLQAHVRWREPLIRHPPPHSGDQP